MASNQELQRFLNAFNKDLEEYLPDDVQGSPEARRASTLVELYLSYLDDSGSNFNPIMCPHEDLTGRNRCRISAFELQHDGLDLNLFIGYSVPADELTVISTPDLRKVCSQGARFFDHIVHNRIDRFSESRETLDAATDIYDKLAKIENVQVLLFTNGLVKADAVDPLVIKDTPVSFELYDIKRLQRIVESGSTRPDIDIDFSEYLGRPLSCLQMRPIPAEYQTYLTIMPGTLLFDLYDKYGPQLLEFNVRSFLQARGKVNKGILETLKGEPERFMAYNNGLAATADEIETSNWHGEDVIHRIRGLQIVNGGQTTASIHRAAKNMKLDVSKVFVPMKLTLVQVDKLSEFVPLISKHSNTQNVIQVADLSANHEFHIRLEQLSQSVWCPGEQQRWFYERARGSYQVEIGRLGTTPARLREIKKELPTSKRFSKTDLAKYLMAWLGRPQTVSRGAQKNFSIFMEELGDLFPPDWEPDEAFFREAVSKCLVFRAADKTVRKAGYSYKANIVAYMVSYLSHVVSGQLNFDVVWLKQSISGELSNLFEAWCHLIYKQLVDSAEGRNVSEWCKKDDCWQGVRNLKLDFPADTLPETNFENREDDSYEAQNDPSLEPLEKQRGKSLEEVKDIPAATWARIAYWGLATGKLTYVERGVAHTLSEMAHSGWKKDPSNKQIHYALKAVQLAQENSIIES